MVKVGAKYKNKKGEVYTVTAADYSRHIITIENDKEEFDIGWIKFMVEFEEVV